MSVVTVVVNDQGQHSLWPSDRDLPCGWSPTGVRGTTEECLTHIEKVWIEVLPRDTRGRPPLSKPTHPPTVDLAVESAVGADHV